jgi:hypothetical protein
MRRRRVRAGLRLWARCGWSSWDCYPRIRQMRRVHTHHWALVRAAKPHDLRDRGPPGHLLLRGRAVLLDGHAGLHDVLEQVDPRKTMPPAALAAAGVTMCRGPPWPGPATRRRAGRPPPILTSGAKGASRWSGNVEWPRPSSSASSSGSCLAWPRPEMTPPRQSRQAGSRANFHGPARTLRGRSRTPLR